MSTITVANGKPISAIATTASLQDTDKFLISRSLTNYAISYADFKTDLSADLGISLPLTTNGDMIIRSGGSNVRLGIGSAGQVLTVSGGLPSWQSLSLYTDPLTTNGDILRRAGGITTRLAAGTNGQVLTISSGLPVWSTPATGGLADPLTTNGDIIARISGVTTRVGIGSESQFLRVSSGIPAWETVNVFTDPLTTNGDIIRRAGGVTTRLAIGTSGQVLTVSGGLPVWATPSSFVDPLTTNGDLIARLSGTTTRLPVGTNGQYLSVSAGVPTWVDAPFLDTPVISGTATYYPKFATASTLGDSTTYEDGSGIHLTGNVLIKEGSNTSSVKIGNQANSSTAANGEISTGAAFVRVTQNINNTHVNEPAASVKLSPAGIDLAFTNDASGSVETIGLFNSNGVLITKNTEVDANLAVSGSLSIKGSFIDVVTNVVEVKSTGGIKTVSPGNTIITADSGSWKLGKHYTDGTAMAISATDYLEVDVNGTKYKLALIGTGGGSGGAAVTTFNMNLSGTNDTGFAMTFYYAITATNTPPSDTDYFFLGTLVDGAVAVAIGTVSVTDDYYLWLFHEGSPVDGTYTPDVVITVGGGGGGGDYTNARSFRIDQEVNIAFTTV